MSKDYRKNKKLNEYFEFYIKQMGIDEKFTPLLVDVMLRRTIEFDLNPNEIAQEMTSLMNNLTAIEIGKMPKNCENAAGIYSYADKKIVISEDYVRNAKSVNDFEILYEIFTHETYHALARNQYGQSKISTNHAIDGSTYMSLEEAIVEKAADRCIFSRKWSEDYSPFFHQNEFGYSDITYITDVIEAAYGVSEKAFLRNALKGRENLCNFLSSISGEKIEETKYFLNSIEVNYSRLHKALYDKDLKGSELEREVKDSTAALLNLAYYKLNSNLKKIDTRSENCENAKIKLDEYKYGFDKMQLVVKHATNGFDKRFKNNAVSEYVRGEIANKAKENSCMINTMSELLENRKNMPTTTFNTMMFFLKQGRANAIKDMYKKNNISLEPLEFIPLKDEFLAYRKNDFEETEWDNSFIINQIIQMKYQFENEHPTLKSRIKKGFGAIKDLLFNKKQKLLPEGTNPIISKSNGEFAALTPEELQNFRKGEKETITACIKNGDSRITNSQNEINKNIDEGPEV